VRVLCPAIFVGDPDSGDPVTDVLANAGHRALNDDRIPALAAPVPHPRGGLHSAGMTLQEGRTGVRLTRVSAAIKYNKVPPAEAAHFIFDYDRLVMIDLP